MEPLDVASPLKKRVFYDYNFFEDAEHLVDLQGGSGIPIEPEPDPIYLTIDI